MEMPRDPQKSPASFLRASILFMALAPALASPACIWPRDNSNDEQRCDPRCVPGHICREGTCEPMKPDGAVPDLQAVDLSTTDMPEQDMTELDMTELDGGQDSAPDTVPDFWPDMAADSAPGAG